MSPKCRAWCLWRTVCASALPLLFVSVAVHGLSDCHCETLVCIPRSELNCTYGIINESGPCFCCPGCRVGPGEECGGLGLKECAVGYLCDRGPLRPLESHQPVETQPGTCIRNSSAPSPTPDPPHTEPPTPSPTPTAAGTVEEPTIDEPTVRPTATDPETHCRPRCSVDFCGADDSGKARICAAQDLVYQRVQGRGNCQHTSCKSCFLLLEPQCDTQCEDPPSKKCLRQYYDCIRSHYFDSTTDSILLPLEDPTARTRQGRVICHVPAVVGG